MKGKETGHESISNVRRALEEKGVPSENIEAYLHIFKKLSSHIKQYKKNNRVQTLESLREELLSWLKKAQGNGFEPNIHLFNNAFMDMILKIEGGFYLKHFVEDFVSTSGNQSDFARHFLEHALSRDLLHFTGRYYDDLVCDFMNDGVLPDNPDKNKDADTFRRRRNRRKRVFILQGLRYYQRYLQRKGEALFENLPEHPQGYLKEIAIRLQIILPDPYIPPTTSHKIPFPRQGEGSLEVREGRFIKSTETKS